MRNNRYSRLNSQRGHRNLNSAVKVRNMATAVADKQYADNLKRFHEDFDRYYSPEQVDALAAACENPACPLTFEDALNTVVEIELNCDSFADFAHKFFVVSGCWERYMDLESQDMWILDCLNWEDVANGLRKEMYMYYEPSHNAVVAWYKN